MARWALALALALTLAAPANAQVGRLLPSQAKLGEIIGSQQPFPMIQIGSQVLRLAPGALIYDQNNRTIVHNALPERAAILYTQGPADEVTRIYILRPEELEAAQRARNR